VKIILSRKGFDSTSGGKPSPILPDGRMVSLPIPDKDSKIRYRDIHWQEHDLGSLVEPLTGGRIPASHFAHLDSDLAGESLPRSDGWRPLFGQIGAAQGHLQNNNIQPRDVFLFFGLFQDVTKSPAGFAWDTSSRKRHVIWGWLQVDEIVSVDGCIGSAYEWARYHPHFRWKGDSSNTLYIASRDLSRSLALPAALPGAGRFSHYSDQLALTDPCGTSPTQWKLPQWLFPRDGKTPLTYHSDAKRWERIDGGTRLNSVARGQEFVLNTSEFPEAIDWLASLMGLHQDFH
jgi:hypothetical protein